MNLLQALPERVHVSSFFSLPSSNLCFKKRFLKANTKSLFRWTERGFERKALDTNKQTAVLATKQHLLLDGYIKSLPKIHSSL